MAHARATTSRQKSLTSVLTHGTPLTVVAGIALLDGRAKMPTYPQLSSSHTSATSQDMMPPFDQLGFEHSPAEFFDASTASYAPDV